MINDRKLIALCTSRIYDPQIHGYIVRLNKLLKAKDFSLLIFAINSDIYWEEDRQAAEKYVFNLIPYDFVDAVIIMDEKIKSHKIAHKIIDASNSHNVPVIISDGRYENASCINFDYEAGFEKVVRHVIEYHHVKKPHMMAGQPDNDFSNRRIEVFKKVLKENEIEFDDSMISYGYFWADPCRKATEELLKRDELPEAVICANDIMAITVIEMFKASGISVPKDVIISGFDGYDEIYFTSPKITTASCDIISLAEATAEVTLEAVKRHENISHNIIPVFIPNESCGCSEHVEHPQMLQDWFKESFSRHNDDNRVLKRLTAKMQISQNPGAMVSHLECYKTDNLLTVVDKNCFNSDINYFTDTETDEAPKDFILIYDSEHPEKYKEDTFSLNNDNNELSVSEEISSSENVLSPAIRDRVIELAGRGYPLIFNALDYMGKAYGFVCYFFPDYYINNYSNTINATNAIGTGIGGYINIQYQRALLEKMDEMYRRDPLTGLYNRIGFQNEFKKLRANPKYKDAKITVIMSDLDGLKFINDNFGHANGDNAITQVANALFNSVPENSLSTRFGGDEVFSVIFDDCDAELIIKRIEEYLINYNKESGKEYNVSTSCGYITTVLSDDFDLTQAVKDADDKMYDCKRYKYEHNGRPGIK